MAYYYLSYQFRFLKVAKMRKMAKSATDSDEAAALPVVRFQVRMRFPLDVPVAIDNSYQFSQLSRPETSLQVDI